MTGVGCSDLGTSPAMFSADEQRRHTAVRKRGKPASFLAAAFEWRLGTLICYGAVPRPELQFDVRALQRKLP